MEILTGGASASCSCTQTEACLKRNKMQSPEKDSVQRNAGYYNTQNVRHWIFHHRARLAAVRLEL